ncbi:MAG: hypothetical protein FWF73_06755 [Spirochaetes bacterium]|nr:hypothetical protein [Spirochaetota bacterium]
MKNIILIMAIVLSVAFIGCGDDATTLKWDNKSGVAVKDINWYEVGGGSLDTTWKGICNNNTQSDSKEIEVLRGEGTALAETSAGTGTFSPTETDIILEGGATCAEIEKNTDATLVIQSIE